MPASLGGDVYDTCPRRLMFEEPAEFNKAMHFYSQYDKGNLVFAGGLSDQPQAYLTLMAVISSAVSELEDELTRRAKDKASKD